MGLLGLRRFIDASGCTRVLSVPLQSSEASYEDLPPSLSSSSPQEDASFVGKTACGPIDHVLIDLNCIIHSCLRCPNAVREEAAAPETQGYGSSSARSHQATPAVGTRNKAEVIAAVLHRLEWLLNNVVVPMKSLTICLDGPAPLAKLQIQRLRRRKLSLIESADALLGDQGSGGTINGLSISAGSLFMVELENAIASAFKENRGQGFLPQRCPVFLHGTTVMGEGEAKISRGLAYLAYGSATEPSTGYQNCGPPPYHPDDSVLILGNDIDLVMTALGMTCYHNIRVLSPESLQSVNVGELIYRWLKSASQLGSAAGSTLMGGAEELAFLRINFVFLFLLNGGDHYPGAGDIAAGLWQRFKTVRGAAWKTRAHAAFSLVSPSLDRICTATLCDTLQADSYTGEADPQVGIRLLQSALWALQTTVTGICPDYRYLPVDTDQPTLAHLRAAAVWCKRRRQDISFSVKPDVLPLTPLEHYVALMPSIAAMPKGVGATLRTQPALRRVGDTLLQSHDPLQVARAAEAAVEAASSKLRHSESYLRQFTQPVQLNALPPPVRLSRHEQHRRLALASKEGSSVHVAKFEEQPPVVQVLYLPKSLEEAPMLNLCYPSSVQELHFTSMFRPGDRPHKEAHPAAQEEGPFQKPLTKGLKSSTALESSSSLRVVPVFHNMDAFAAATSSGATSLAEGGAGEGGVDAILKHQLGVVHRLKERGIREATGRKTRKRLRKAQETVKKSLLEGAAGEDWRYAVDLHSGEDDGDDGELIEDEGEQRGDSNKASRKKSTKKSEAKELEQSLLQFLEGDHGMVKKLLRDSAYDPSKCAAAGKSSKKKSGTSAYPVNDDDAPHRKRLKTEKKSKEVAKKKKS